MWRATCLAIDDLNASANADDAQIATSIRCRGWRTVADPMAHFVDAAPSTVKDSGVKNTPSTRFAALAHPSTQASHDQKPRSLRPNFPSPTPFPHRRTVGPDRCHGLRCPAVGIHCALRLASDVHLGQQPSPRFYRAGTHQRCVVVAKSTRKLIGAAFARWPVVRKYGNPRSLVGHHGTRALVAPMGAAHRRRERMLDVEV